MDVKDVFNVVNYCVGKVNNEIIYVSGLEIVSVVDLIEKIGYILNINPKYTIQEKNESLGWSILNSNIFKEYINNTEIEYNGYTERIQSLRGISSTFSGLHSEKYFTMNKGDVIDFWAGQWTYGDEIYYGFIQLEFIGPF